MIAALFVAVTGAACVINFLRPLSVDFISFWAAAQMLGGDPYDTASHAAVAAQAAPPRGLLPFVYPPPFLLFVAPFGLLDYGLAFAAWTLVTGTCYWIATRQFAAFAHPSVVFTGLVGQSSFLTAAIFIAGFRALATRPFVAGAILGCLVIKPQLAVLIPIALIAGKEWKAIGGAAASSLGLLGVSLVAFGPDAFRGFALAVGHFSQYLTDGRWEWNELASIYALARYCGAGPQAAMVAHALIAALAAMLCWRSWQINHPDKVALFASATLLIPPYIFSYDYLLLIIPMQVILSRRFAIGAMVWGLAAIPLLKLLHVDAGPNPLPIAAIVCLVVLSWPKLAQGESKQKRPGLMDPGVLA